MDTARLNNQSLASHSDLWEKWLQQNAEKHESVEKRHIKDEMKRLYNVKKKFSRNALFLIRDDPSAELIHRKLANEMILAKEHK